METEIDLNYKAYSYSILLCLTNVYDRIYWFLFALISDGIDAVDMKERVNKIDKEKPVLPRITKELDGYVGFANFPNQVYRKAIKKGFEFTLMVVGKFSFEVISIVFTIESRVHRVCVFHYL